MMSDWRTGGIWNKPRQPEIHVDGDQIKFWEVEDEDEATLLFALPFIDAVQVARVILMAWESWLEGEEAMHRKGLERIQEMRKLA